MSSPEWTCKNCETDNLIGWDWETCLQECDQCGSQHEVVCKVTTVKMVVKKDLDQDPTPAQEGEP